MQWPEFAIALTELTAGESGAGHLERPNKQATKNQETAEGEAHFPQPEVCLPQSRRPHNQHQKGAGPNTKKHSPGDARSHIMTQLSSSLPRQPVQQWNSAAL